MKRVIGMFFLVLICIMLGLSVDYVERGDVTLVGEWHFEYGGVYE